MKLFAAAALVFLVFAYVTPLAMRQEAQPPSTVTSVPGTIQPPAPGAPTQPAVAVTTVPSPASPQNPTDQLMWAAAASYLLRYICKKRWLPFFTPESEARAKAQVAFVVALITAAGIHIVVNGSPFDGAGATLTVSGLTFDAVKDVGFQWLSQQGIYDIIVKRTV